MPGDGREDGWGEYLNHMIHFEHRAPPCQRWVHKVSHIRSLTVIISHGFRLWRLGGLGWEQRCMRAL